MVSNRDILNINFITKLIKLADISVVGRDVTLHLSFASAILDDLSVVSDNFPIISFSAMVGFANRLKMKTTLFRERRVVRVQLCHLALALFKKL